MPYACFDTLMAAGQKHGLRPAGYKALDSLRIEKGYLYWSGDITPEDNPLEAGLGFLCVRLKKTDFIGREALMAIKQRGCAPGWCALTMDAGGKPLRRGVGLCAGRPRRPHPHRRLRATPSARTIGLVYLPPDLAKAGTALEVEILGERVKAQVAELPLVDPKGEKIRA